MSHASCKGKAARSIGCVTCQTGASIGKALSALEIAPEVGRPTGGLQCRCTSAAVDGMERIFFRARVVATQQARARSLEPPVDTIGLLDGEIEQPFGVDVVVAVGCLHRGPGVRRRGE